MESIKNCLTFVQSQWQSVPYGSKVCVLVSLAVYCADIILFDFLFNLFKDVPLQVIEGYQVQRIFLQEFVHGYLYNLIISLLSFYIGSFEFEKQIGTVAFLIDFLVKNIIVQTIYIMMCMALSLLWDRFLLYPSFGLWNVTMVYFTNKALMVPDEDMSIVCLPFSIKARFCPLIIIVFLNIFEFPRLDLTAGFLLGYLEYRFFNGVLFRPAYPTLKRIEGCFLFGKSQSRQDFITCDHNHHQFMFTSNPFMTQLQSLSIRLHSTSDSEVNQTSSTDRQDDQERDGMAKLKEQMLQVDENDIISTV